MADTVVFKNFQANFYFNIFKFVKLIKSALWSLFRHSPTQNSPPVSMTEMSQQTAEYSNFFFHETSIWQSVKN